MESTFDLEDRLVRLDVELHKILHSVKVSKVKRVKDEETEIQSLRGLVDRINSHRIVEKDTTILIREMRERTYEI